MYYYIHASLKNTVNVLMHSNHYMHTFKRNITHKIILHNWFQYTSVQNHMYI